MNSSTEAPPRISEASDDQLEKVMRQIIDAKMEVVVFRKKRRILLEEIHRQFLEGECEPKKRLKSLNDVKKKKVVNSNSGTQPPSNSSIDKLKQDEADGDII